jgi:hypothetical protein
LHSNLIAELDRRLVNCHHDNGYIYRAFMQENMNCQLDTYYDMFSLLVRKCL